MERKQKVKPQRGRPGTEARKFPNNFYVAQLSERGPTKKHKLVLSSHSELVRGQGHRCWRTNCLLSILRTIKENHSTPLGAAILVLQNINMCYVTCNRK